MIRKHLTPSELERLVEQFTKSADSDMHFDRYETRLVLMLEIMARTGMRTDEALRFTVGSIDRANSTIHVHRAAKNSYKGSMRVPEDLIVRMLYLATKDNIPADREFSLILIGAPTQVARQRRLQRFWDVLRFKLYGTGCPITLHGLRHTAASVIYRASGNDVRAVKSFLRHKSLSSSFHYISAMDFEDVQELLKSTPLGRAPAKKVRAA